MEEQATNLTVKSTRSVSIATMVTTIILVGVVSFVAGTRSDTLLARISSSQDPSSLDFSSLNEVYNVLRTDFDGKLNTQALIDGAKHGMVEATGDPYTTYLTAKEASEFDNNLEGSFQGIGAELAKREDVLIVVSTLDDSPAKRSGLLANDVIVKVNDVDASAWSVEQAVSKIKGEKGTTVKLTVVRGEQALKDFSITREAINNPSVRSEITADNIGILRISRFGDTDTVTLSTRAANEFKAKGVRSVIVDLRGNGGGYLTTARDLASLWLEDKVVTKVRRDGKVTDTFRSGNNAPLKGIKTIVLVDGGSASASEILAGALTDNKTAILVGAKTFGKGSVQAIKKINGGGELKVTTSKWYTPNGKNVTTEGGITPDHVVTMTVEDINAGRDPQRDKALELLR